MRIKLFFQLEKEEINIDYRRYFLSFIKKALEEYDSQYFESLYAKGNNNIKPFTFSMFFTNPNFEKEKIQLADKKIMVEISFWNYEMLIPFYNAFNQAKGKHFSLYQNGMQLTNIVMLPEKKITTEKIRIKFLSPLVVRDHNRETLKDYYYSFQHKEFEEILHINIREQLKAMNFSEELLNGFEIKPILPKKVVVRFYEKWIESSLGVFELKGNQQLLEILYKTGMSSKRSSGFGMFEIL